MLAKLKLGDIHDHKILQILEKVLISHQNMNLVNDKVQQIYSDLIYLGGLNAKTVILFGIK